MDASRDTETGTDATTERNAEAYWRANIRLVLKLLAVWFLASFGLGIIWVEPLNAFSIGGLKLGFFFAQQGSIYVFVVLIFVYARCMNRMDHEYGVDDD